MERAASPVEDQQRGMTGDRDYNKFAAFAKSVAKQPRNALICDWIGALRGSVANRDRRSPSPQSVYRLG
jgi:hypothetical protein